MCFIAFILKRLAEALTTMFFLIIEGNARLLRLVSGKLIVAVLLCAFFFFLKHSLLRGILYFFVKFCGYLKMLEDDTGT